MRLSPSSSSCVPRRRAGQAEPDRSRTGTGPISMRDVAGVPGGRRSSSMLHMGGWGLCRARLVLVGITESSSDHRARRSCSHVHLGGLRTWEQDRARYQNYFSSRFRCSHQRRMHTSVQHPPSGTRKPRGHRQSHPTAIQPTSHDPQPQKPHHRKPPHPTHAPAPDALTHHNPNTKPNRSQAGTGPISTRVATDLDAELDRSQAGTGPISTRRATDLEPENDRSRGGCQAAYVIPRRRPSHSIWSAIATDHVAQVCLPA